MLLDPILNNDQTPEINPLRKRCRQGEAPFLDLLFPHSSLRATVSVMCLTAHSLSQVKALKNSSGHNISLGLYA